jgi:hypothetical protein
LNTMSRINIWQIMESMGNVVRFSKAVLTLSRAYLHSLNKSEKHSNIRTMEIWYIGWGNTKKEQC